VCQTLSQRGIHFLRRPNWLGQSSLFKGEVSELICLGYDPPVIYCKPDLLSHQLILPELCHFISRPLEYLRNLPSSLAGRSWGWRDINMEFLKWQNLFMRK
jgi:hypothetical protein